MAVYADLMQGRPTPTQDELNDIKMGEHLRTKDPSGAPPAVWPIGWSAGIGVPPQQDAGGQSAQAQQEQQRQQRQQEQQRRQEQRQQEQQRRQQQQPPQQQPPPQPPPQRPQRPGGPAE